MLLLRRLEFIAEVTHSDLVHFRGTSRHYVIQQNEDWCPSFILFFLSLKPKGCPVLDHFHFCQLVMSWYVTINLDYMTELLLEGQLGLCLASAEVSILSSVVAKACSGFFTDPDKMWDRTVALPGMFIFSSTLRGGRPKAKQMKENNRHMLLLYNEI